MQPCYRQRKDVNFYSHFESREIEQIHILAGDATPGPLPEELEGDAGADVDVARMEVLSNVAGPYSA